MHVFLPLSARCLKVIPVMCILFLHTDNSPAPNKFRLILASNRDEYYQRPTQQAHFWDKDPTVVGGTVQVRAQCFRNNVECTVTLPLHISDTLFL